MRKWSQIGLTIVVALAAIATGIYWLGYPQVQTFSPVDESSSVAASSSLSLTFSRAMQPDSVISRLKIQPAIDVSYRWDGQTLMIDPAQPWKTGTTVHVQLVPGARAAGLLALPIQQETSWSFTIRQPRLAFLYPAKGPANIYSMDPDSAEKRQLTSHAAGVQEYSVDEKRSTIYYSAKNDQGGSDLYRLNLSVDGASSEVWGGRPNNTCFTPGLFTG